VETSFALMFGFLGLEVGSFLNVCIDRLPRGESILNPPSRCPVCHHRLEVKDLIPLFSYLQLRGRCRYCKASIPIRLMWIELVTGAMFVFLYYRYGLTPELGVMAFYTCIFTVIFMIDLEHGLILNRVVYFGVVVALLFALFIPQPWITQIKLGGIANFAVGGGIGFVTFLIAALISRGGMGWGDVKLAALIGLATGFPLVFMALIIGSIIGSVVAVFFLIAKKKGRKETIPFGPFLSMGTLITLLWGNEILAWYLGFM